MSKLSDLCSGLYCEFSQLICELGSKILLKTNNFCRKQVRGWFTYSSIIDVALVDTAIKIHQAVNSEGKIIAKLHSTFSNLFLVNIKKMTPVNVFW